MCGDPTHQRLFPHHEEPVYPDNSKPIDVEADQPFPFSKVDPFNDFDDYDDIHRDEPPSEYAYTPLGSLGAKTDITKGDGAFEGYNLFTVQTRDFSSGLIGYSVIIADMEGTIIKERFSSWPVKLINSTFALGIQSQSQIMLWNMVDDVVTTIDIQESHHEMEYNALNNTFMTFSEYTTEIDGQYYMFDIINEYNSTGHLIWSLDTQSFIPHTYWCPFQDIRGSNTADVTHSNSIFFDSDEDIFYFNARNLNTFYKIDHKTGQVLWGLGEYGDFTLYDSKGNQKSSLFYHAHAAEQIDDNTFIIFDNDLHNQTDPNNLRSRILEITINETTMTANESWSWIGPTDYYCVCWGDGDRLPNGNRLGVFGVPDTDHGGRLVEVNEAGEIVWAMNFHNVGDMRYGVYRMERFHYSPILSSPPDILSPLGEDVVVEWEACYNYRPRRTMYGSYSLLLDDVEIDNGGVTYDKFWRPTNLTFNLGTLDEGNYNITLEVTDGEGHVTIDSINVTVGAFFIFRAGPVTFEMGQPENEIRWWGVTCSPLLCNITVNSTLYNETTWNGELVTLNLSSLEEGANHIVLKLYNGTELEYIDSFWVAVYPPAAPIITPSQSNQVEMIWNTSLTLSWALYDDTPSSWSIFLEGTSVASDVWVSPEYLLNWTLPVLEEATYNITVEVFDEAGYRTTNTTWLTVISPSPPALCLISGETELLWGQENALFVWEVHGGYRRVLWKNGVVLSDSIFSGNQIEFLIEHWQAEEWSLGTHNLTLEVVDALGANTTSTVWVQLSLLLGDAYANTFLASNSQYFLFGDNALGPPDSAFTHIFLDYEEGYITLDMGSGEEIYDGPGDDIQILAQGGSYNVKVTNSLSTMFTTIAYGQGSLLCDLAGSGVNQARYVRIEYLEGGTVELDAVEAINYIQGDDDLENPQIIGPQDFWVLETQSEIEFIWETTDATPWTFCITLDGILYDYGPWTGSDIGFNYSPTITGVWRTHNVTLTVFDVCGHQSQDSVLIDVLPVDTENPTMNEQQDFWIFVTQSVLTVTWEAYDLTPLNYTIYVNGEPFELGPWNGTDIIFTYNVTSPGELEVTLNLYDFFGHHAEDTFLVEIRQLGILDVIKQNGYVPIIVGAFFVLAIISVWLLRFRSSHKRAVSD